MCIPYIGFGDWVILDNAECNTCGKRFLVNNSIHAHICTCSSIYIQPVLHGIQPNWAFMEHTKAYLSLL